MTITEAYEITNGLVPAAESVSINMSCWWHARAGERSQVEIQFTVWDGENHCRASTLDGAVKQFLIAHHPPATIEDAEAIIADLPVELIGGCVEDNRRAKEERASIADDDVPF